MHVISIQYGGDDVSFICDLLDLLLLSLSPSCTTVQCILAWLGPQIEQNSPSFGFQFPIAATSKKWGRTKTRKVKDWILIYPRYHTGQHIMSVRGPTCKNFPVNIYCKLPGHWTSTSIYVWYCTPYFLLDVHVHTNTIIRVHTYK